MVIRSKCATEGSLAGILWLWGFLLGQSKSGKEKFIWNVTGVQSLHSLVLTFLFPCTKATINLNRSQSEEKTGKGRQPSNTCRSATSADTQNHLLTPVGCRFHVATHMADPLAIHAGQPCQHAARIALPHTSSTAFTPFLPWLTSPHPSTFRHRNFPPRWTRHEKGPEPWQVPPHRGGPATKNAQNVAGAPPGAVHQVRKGPRTVAGPSPPRRTCYEKHPKRSRHTAMISRLATPLCALKRPPTPVECRFHVATHMADPLAIHAGRPPRHTPKITH